MAQPEGEEDDVNFFAPRDDDEPPSAADDLVAQLRDAADWFDRLDEAKEGELSMNHFDELCEKLGLRDVLGQAEMDRQRFFADPGGHGVLRRGTFLGWFAAQSLKIPTTYVKTGQWRLKAFFTSGGMPSSHSALCMAITSSIAALHGLGSSLFPICLGFSLIVMYDGQGVRRQAGRQAEVLNVVRDELLEGHPVAALGELKELLGHTPAEIVCGAVMGVTVGWATVALGA